MSLLVIFIVLAAALMHATWNALVKGAEDRLMVLGLIALGHMAPGLVILAFTGLPRTASYTYIIASTVIHWGYYWCLNLAYRSGDLSVAYPIARGIAPVLVALGAQVWIGEILPIMAWIGILAVSFGIGILSFAGTGARTPRAGMAPALLTGLTIAAYSLADGVGVRVSGNALAYIALLFAAEAIVAGFIFSTRMHRLRALPARTILLGFAGGVVSSSAYALVLYAKTLAPLGAVSALRETSVIFAALIGVIWLKEAPVSNRLAAACIVAFGIVVLGVAT